MRNYNIQALYHNYLYMEPLFYTIIKLYKKPIKNANISHNSIFKLPTKVLAKQKLISYSKIYMLIYK